MNAVAVWFVSGVEILGELTAMLFASLGFAVRLKFDVRDVVRQMNEIGVNSLPMVSITGFFTGMVLVVQTGDQFVRLGVETYIGGVVALSLSRELAPVLTGIVVAGRMGSAMAAEIGSMKVTEQIDALGSLAISPIKFLVVPRLLATFVMLPMLTLYANAVGVTGGLLVAMFRFGMSEAVFRQSILEQIMVADLAGGLLKGVFFGLIIGLVGCYRGFTTEGGAEGVGRSTTGAVVWSIMLILVANYFLSVGIVNFTGSYLR